MSYKELYDYCQSLDAPVSRKHLRAKLLEVTGVERLAFVVSGNLDPKIVRGMFLSVESGTDWVRQHGCDIVVISRAIYSKTSGGNLCWERFITTKEMMHLFDTDAEASDTGEKFDEILSKLYLVYDGDSTEPVRSEVRCFWRAMGLLCPEHIRREMRQKCDSGTATTLDVALRFMIPEQYVGPLLSDKYPDIFEQHTGVQC